MIMAFLTRQFCSAPEEAIALFYDIWDGTKRREPAQPQRLRWQIRGLGAEPTNKLFAKSSRFALLATTISLPGPRFILDGSQICDPCLRGVISLFMIRLNQRQFFPFATFSPVPSFHFHRKCKASRFSTRSILPL